MTENEREREKIQPSCFKDYFIVISFCDLVLSYLSAAVGDGRPKYHLSGPSVLNDQSKNINYLEVEDYSATSMPAS